MSKELISLETAIEWAREEIAIEGEDFIYGADRRQFENSIIDCFYYEADGSPSCIVGRILDRHGLMDFEGSRGIEGASVRQIPVVRSRFTDEARQFLSLLQTHQDDGRPWGIALHEAINQS